MTGVGGIYGKALYSLARDEGLSQVILRQLTTLEGCFSREPDFLRLLNTPNLSKEQRYRILDDGFRGRIEPYVLNFLKILTKNGHARLFGDCAAAYRALYNRDNGILPVTAVTAVALTRSQKAKLTATLTKITGKRIELTNQLDPGCLGGVRLDYDGMQVDDTVAHRMDVIRSYLKNTLL